MILLITGIVSGILIGLIFGVKAAVLKPLGDILLNLLFTAVVPLVFFSIASAIAGMKDVRRLARVMGWMMVFFVRLLGGIGRRVESVLVEYPIDSLYGICHRQQCGDDTGES